MAQTPSFNCSNRMVRANERGDLNFHGEDERLGNGIMAGWVRFKRGFMTGEGVRQPCTHQKSCTLNTMERCCSLTQTETAPLSPSKGERHRRFNSAFQHGKNSLPSTYNTRKRPTYGFVMAMSSTPWSKLTPKSSGPEIGLGKMHAYRITWSIPSQGMPSTAQYTDLYPK